MLVLTRHCDQDVCIGPNIRVRVLSVHGNQVRLGIEAPAEVAIYRAELLDAVREQNEAAGRPPDWAGEHLRRVAALRKQRQEA